jgi:hypothetical protein
MTHDWPAHEVAALAQAIDSDLDETENAINERWTKLVTNLVSAETAVLEANRVGVLVTAYTTTNPDAAAAAAGDRAYHQFAEQRTAAVLGQLKSEFEQHAREYAGHAHEAHNTLANFLVIGEISEQPLTFPGAQESLNRASLRLRTLPR